MLQQCHVRPRSTTCVRLSNTFDDKVEYSMRQQLTIPNRPVKCVDKKKVKFDFYSFNFFFKNILNENAWPFKRTKGKRIFLPENPPWRTVEISFFFLLSDRCISTNSSEQSPQLLRSIGSN